MCAFRTFHTVIFLSTAAILAANLRPALAADTETSIAACDALASDPYDPGRNAPGVFEEGFAPGAAIAACERAVADYPDEARLLFQLGRSYWMAHHDTEALEAFNDAAGLGYAPAMKYVGDAYLEGRGLPEGEHQDKQIALQWFRRAAEHGYRAGARAVTEVLEDIAKSIFDPNRFQNPTYIKALYDGTMEDVDTPVFFMYYVRSFSEELGGDKLLYVDQHCRPLVTALGQTILDIGQWVSYLALLKDEKSLVRNGLSILTSDYATDQGKIDATNLVNHYGCSSDIARKITSNITVSYQAAERVVTRLLGSP